MVPNQGVQGADELVDHKVIKAALWSSRVPEDLFNTLQQFSGSAIWSHCDCLVNSNSAHRNWERTLQSKKSSPFTGVTILKSGSETPDRYSSRFFILIFPTRLFWRKIIRETVNPELNTTRIFSVKFDVSVWGCEWRHITANAQKSVNRFELILPRLWADSMPASQSRSYTNTTACLMCCYLSLSQYALATQNSPAYYFPHYTEVCRN